MAKLLVVVLFRFGLWSPVITVAPVAAGSVLLFSAFEEQLTLSRFVGEGIILGGRASRSYLNAFHPAFGAQGARATNVGSVTNAGKTDYAAVPLLGSQPRCSGPAPI